ncbi:MAG TPA: MFS transporter [Pseudonocardia sp.]|nr:MFS transporter [Pseudonocardia sp.]
MLDRPDQGASRRPLVFLLLICALSTCGYSMLLAVVPLWVSRGGSGAFGSGASTGVFMLATVLTQLAVPWLLRRFGHRVALGGGLVLLGAPAPLLTLSAELAPVLVLSALRGVGFGLFTVASGALVAELVPPAEHGRSTALFGLATGVPQLLLLPTGVGAVQHLGFTGVFLAAAVPLLGLPLLAPIRLAGGVAGAGRSGAVRSGAGGGAADGVEPVGVGMPPGPELSAAPELARELAPGAAGPAGDVAGGARRGGSVGPVVAMLGCATAQGALVTFLPLAVTSAVTVVPIALLGTAGGAVLGRVVAGHLVDRRGWGGRLLGPGVLLAVVGMVAEVLVSGFPGLSGAVLLVVGAALVGLGFGLVQNDSLVAMFAAAGTARYGRASAVWNIAYDAGTGAGAVGLGAVAQLFGFRVTFGVSAALLVLVLPVLALYRRRA